MSKMVFLQSTHAWVGLLDKLVCVNGVNVQGGAALTWNPLLSLYILLVLLFNIKSVIYWYRLSRFAIARKALTFCHHLSRASLLLLY